MLNELKTFENSLNYDLVQFLGVKIMEFNILIAFKMRVLRKTCPEIVLHVSAEEPHIQTQKQTYGNKIDISAAISR